MADKAAQNLDPVFAEFVQLTQEVKQKSYFEHYKIQLDAKKIIQKGQAKVRENKGSSGFLDGVEFLKWWIAAWKAQDGSCYYCESKFSDIATLITAGLLQERQIANGVRGPFPEIERLESGTGKNVYSAKNCVLACYYCNNDKSYIYSSTDYKNHFGPVKGSYIRYLLKKLEV